MSNRILLIRLRFLGDVLLSTPAIRAIRKRYPDAIIHYVVAEGCEGALAGNPHVDKILIWRPRAAWGEKIRWMMALRKERYDMAVDWWGSSTSAFMVWLSGASLRVGFDYPMRKWLYSHVLKASSKPLNAVEVYLQALGPLGAGVDGMSLEYRGGEAFRSHAEGWLTAQGIEPAKPVLGVFPGATWSAKRWPVDRFARVIQRLVEQRQTQVVIFEGPKELGVAEAMTGLLPDSVKRKTYIAQGLTFQELGALMSRCRAMLTNDAAPMHLAAALSIPTVAVFGPGNAKIWFPYTVPHVAFQKEVGCCQQNTCVKDHACLSAVTVDEVLAALEKFL